MMTAPQLKIHNLETLKREKERLNAFITSQEALLKDDMKYLKDEFSFSDIVSKAAASIVPAAVRRSSVVNVPVNFVARTIFGEEENVVSTESDRGKGNKIRNVILGLLEGSAAYFITKAIRKRL